MSSITAALVVYGRITAVVDIRVVAFHEHELHEIVIIPVEHFECDLRSQLTYFLRCLHDFKSKIGQQRALTMRDTAWRHSSAVTSSRWFPLLLVTEDKYAVRHGT